MDTEPPGWVREALSKPRFAPYLARVAGDVDAAIELYWWNVELSEAFYPPLHCLELALRNALHTKLCQRFGRVDWWAAAPLSKHGRLSVESAEQTLVRRGRRPPVSDDVVAELSLGFWVSLISRAYDRGLWVPTLHRAFPFYGGSRRALYEDFEFVRVLRNRVMHYEPIHHRHLAADRSTIYRLLGHISPEMVTELEARDRLPDVLGCRGKI